MLLDLGRNDTGKVSKIGTVHPTEEFIIERYSHVMHIVSNVVGELREDEDALSALLAGLPAGTVSGATESPRDGDHRRAGTGKTRRLWRRRGLFLRWWRHGHVHRAAHRRPQDEKLYIQAGGGVVYDSSPEGEYQETVNKSNALRKAAEDAGLFYAVGQSLSRNALTSKARLFFCQIFFCLEISCGGPGVQNPRHPLKAATSSSI